MARVERRQVGQRLRQVLLRQAVILGTRVSRQELVPIAAGGSAPGSRGYVALGVILRVGFDDCTPFPVPDAADLADPRSVFRGLVERVQHLFQEDGQLVRSAAVPILRDLEASPFGVFR